jgi:predicted O-methyltransferase YrrM
MAATIGAAHGESGVGWRGLDDPRVAAVLAELYAAAADDAERLDEAWAAASRLSERPTVEQMSELAGQIALPVDPAVGRLIYSLVRASGARRVVEFGTSFGVSLLHIAAALRENGEGQVWGSELHAAKVARARAAVSEAGLSDYAQVLEGEARETLPALPGPIDLVLLDGWKELYLPVLRSLEPSLRSGTAIVADNLSMLPHEYTAYVRRPDGPYTSMSLPLGEGVELSVREL